MNRLNRHFSQEWHVAINAFSQSRGHRKWMYEAKTMADEIPRMAKLFEMERLGKLPKIHRQCSHSKPEQIPDNHLTCCLGVKCKECPELAALNAIKESSYEGIDLAKAWTCAAHIVSKGGDIAREGYILRLDDRMYWDRVYENLRSDKE